MFARGKKYIKRLLNMGEGNEVLKDLSSVDKELISRIRAKQLTYLSERKLAGITTSCYSIEKSNLPGLFIEAGCALGGSSILMASIKSNDRPLFIYDVFGLIPPPTKDDPKEVHERYRTIVSGESKGLGDDTYYGYQENLLDIVKSNIDGFGIDCDRQHVKLIKGLVQDTLHIDRPVALAHIDVDWYEPVKTCLERIYPKLILGGSIILDDYHDWGGCRKATDEYLQNVDGQFSLDDSAGSMKITRTR